MTTAQPGLRIELSGVVQGVGFRPWVHRLATQSGITGSVMNGPQGVTIEAFGAGPALDGFLHGLRGDAPPAARIESLEATPIDGAAPEHFIIAPSREAGGRQLAIGPDMASCAACLAEVRNPRDRRYRYPFANCTQCGPRWSIALDIPYDRQRTTMSPFWMCDDCRREYESVSDRRFHAQPNACARCGPRVSLRDARGTLDGDPLVRAAELLRQGAIVLVKGLGGYHLACDATQDDVVAELRRRKARDHKPFAVMVADLDAAEAVCRVDPMARELLTSVERPIVLMPRGERPLAAAVAPDSARLGVMLPYSPLHQLLLDQAGRPLVMTSANLADEPTLYRDEPALAFLQSAARRPPVADCALTHDRTIATRVDDSIATVIDGAPMILRRSRGWVPRPVMLASPVAEPVLGCGAQLKNTICLAVGNLAYPGPHIGDLDSVESYRSFVESIERYEAMLGVHAEVIAHDAHPDLLSTRYALERPGRHIAVQHHHAHIASLLCERGLTGPVIGVAFDGTGHGLDGDAWGGEILIADRVGFSRRATLRPLPLLGGDRAVREPWRLALALLDDAFDGAPPLDALTLFRGIDPHRVEMLRKLRGKAPRAHGAGRYFDAFGALILGRAVADYEAQLAMALELAADSGVGGYYDFDVDTSLDPWSIDLRPAVRQATREIVAGVRGAAIAMRVHRTLAAATAAVVRACDPALPIAMSGGCFQNAVLARAMRRALPERELLCHRQVPPNDGGIALGQVWAASGLIEKERSTCA